MDVRYVPIVPCEDERCPCHDTATNDELFAEYIERPVMAGLLTASEGLRLYWGEQI